MPKLLTTASTKDAKTTLVYTHLLNRAPPWMVKAPEELKVDLKKQDKDCQQYWQELAKALRDTGHLGEADSIGIKTEVA